VGRRLRARSIIGSEFVCRIARPTTIGGRPGIVPIYFGPGLDYRVSQYMLDPADPWPSGYRYRIHGRALGRQFERYARFARLS
jgi:proline racemase